MIVFYNVTLKGDYANIYFYKMHFPTIKVKHKSNCYKHKVGRDEVFSLTGSIVSLS